MKKIRLEILGLSSSHSQTGSFALVLGEEKGNRRLPIIIGMFEAQAIAIEIEKIAPNRPMTHDLFRSFSDAFGFDVAEIVISDLKEGVFFAKIVSTDGKMSHEIDARPSDAIAIGLRFGVPIYTYEALMSEAGIILSDAEEAEEGDIDNISTNLPSTSDSDKDKMRALPKDQLKKLLEDAVNNEDFEVAAKIRDELNKRN